MNHESSIGQKDVISVDRLAEQLSIDRYLNQGIPKNIAFEDQCLPLNGVFHDGKTMRDHYLRALGFDSSVRAKVLEMLDRITAERAILSLGKQAEFRKNENIDNIIAGIRKDYMRWLLDWDEQSDANVLFRNDQYEQRDLIPDHLIAVLNPDFTYKELMTTLKAVENGQYNGFIIKCRGHDEVFLNIEISHKNIASIEEFTADYNNERDLFRIYKSFGKMPMQPIIEKV